jgi:hypothetical protein
VKSYNTDFSLVYRSALAHIFSRSQPMRESNTANLQHIVNGIFLNNIDSDIFFIFYLIRWRNIYIFDNCHSFYFISSVLMYFF